MSLFKKFWGCQRLMGDFSKWTVIQNTISWPILGNQVGGIQLIYVKVMTIILVKLILKTH